MIGKHFNIYSFQITGKWICETLLSMVWSNHQPSMYNILPVNLPKIKFPHLLWKAFRKGSLHTLWGETVCPCSTGKSCGAVFSLNICKEVQIKTREHTGLVKKDCMTEQVRMSCFDIHDLISLTWRSLPWTAYINYLVGNQIFLLCHQDFLNKPVRET